MEAQIYGPFFKLLDAQYPPTRGSTNIIESDQYCILRRESFSSTKPGEYTNSYYSVPWTKVEDFLVQNGAPDVCFHEISFGEYEKLKFDIETEDVSQLDEFELTLTTLMDRLMTALSATYTNFRIFRYESSTATKLSAHIVVDMLCFRASLPTQQGVTKHLGKLYAGDLKFVDLQVYKTNQSFRLLSQQKPGKTNMKRLVETRKHGYTAKTRKVSYLDSMVTYVERSEIVAMAAPVEAKQELNNSDNFGLQPNEITLAYEKLCELEGEGVYSLKRMRFWKGTVCFPREPKTTTICCCCKRGHETADKFIASKKVDGRWCIMLHCYRGSDTVYLCDRLLNVGKLYAETYALAEEQRLNEQLARSGSVPAKKVVEPVVTKVIAKTQKISQMHTAFGTLTCIEADELVF